MAQSRQSISDTEKLKKDVRILQWALGMTMFLALITFLVLLHFLRGQVHTERIEVMPIKEIDHAPKETKSYICTSGVNVEDLRGKCHDCELWFHGEGQCAVVLP